MITSDLPFGEWGQVFQGERMTAALLDRLTHKCHFFEMNGGCYRFRVPFAEPGGSITDAAPMQSGTTAPGS